MGIESLLRKSECYDYLFLIGQCINRSSRESGMCDRAAISRKSLNLIGQFSVVNGNKIDFQRAAATVGLPLAIRVTYHASFTNQNQLTAVDM